MSEYNNVSTDITIPLADVPVGTGSFEPIPDGVYTLQALDVTMTMSKAMNRMLKVQFAVIGGEYDNRRIFETFNIEHGNSKVVEIALQQIKAWCIATGMSGDELLTFEILQSLCGKEFSASVKIEEDKYGQYPSQNRIKTYKKVRTAASRPNNATPFEHRPVATTAAPAAKPSPFGAPPPAQSAANPYPPVVASAVKPWESIPATDECIPF